MVKCHKTYVKEVMMYSDVTSSDLYGCGLSPDKCHTSCVLNNRHSTPSLVCDTFQAFGLL